MSNPTVFEGWVVAHSMMGVMVVTEADRAGQCNGGGKRVTFEANDLISAQSHEEHCVFCWTNQRVAGVNGPINRNLI